MSLKLTVLFFGLSIALIASANPLGSGINDIAHHKAALLRDFITGGGMTANAIATIRCQHENPSGCTAGGTFGEHPSERQVLGLAIPLTGAVIAANHLAVHFARNKEDQDIPWGWAAPLGVANLFRTITDLQSATPTSGTGGRVPRPSPIR